MIFLVCLALILLIFGKSEIKCTRFMLKCLSQVRIWSEFCPYIWEHSFCRAFSLLNTLCDFQYFIIIVEVQRLADNYQNRYNVRPQVIAPIMSGVRLRLVIWNKKYVSSYERLFKVILQQIKLVLNTYIPGNKYNFFFHVNTPYTSIQNRINNAVCCSI